MSVMHVHPAVQVNQAPHRWSGVASVVLVILSLGCGGDEPSKPVVVSVEPATATVQVGWTRQFTATVTGMSNQAVTWSVVGGDGNGTISAPGLYTAPATVPNPATVAVRATSVADPNKSGTATVTVTLLPVVGVNMGPRSATLQVNQTQQFAVTVTGTANTAVTWEVEGGAGTGSITSSGLYTAPAAVPNPATVTVRATSEADTSVSGTAQVTIVPVGPSPTGFLRVPAGSFTMGDGRSNSYCGTEQHTVTLTHDFYLGQTEVTNQQYLEALQRALDQGYVAVLDSIVYDRLDGRSGTEIALMYLAGYGSEIGFSGGAFSLRDAGHGINANHPVTEVTWYGAVAYCDWLSVKAGLPRAYNHGTWTCNGGKPYTAQGYRLPTDAEWEFAGQYDDERIYPWGNEDQTCERTNRSGCVGWTSPVGSYPAEHTIGGKGLYDMAGNVWEWCNDWHTCDLGTAARQDPPGPSSGTYRVLRGGSWGSSGDGSGLRCASRYSYYPVPAFRGYGFRVARTATS